MSSPHFYQADEKFADDIIGLRPTKKEHETAIDINPVRTCIMILASFGKPGYEKLSPFYDIFWHPCI